MFNLSYDEFLEYYFPVAFVSLVGLFCAIAPVWWLASIGERQRREAGGTSLRLFCVSVAGCGIALLPFILAAFLYNTILYRDHEVSYIVPYAFGLSIVSWFGITRAFSPPAVDGEEPLPLVTDAAFLTRMSNLAARMRLRLPTMRVLRSPSPHQTAGAWAGGLPCLSIVFSEGIFHRLDPIEQDTIAAHEMAHIANGSMWIYAAFIPLACCVSVIALANGVSTWLVFIPASYVGLWRILSRRLEYDCDLRAARAVGFPELATALIKIYKIGFGSRTTWLLRWMYATDGHPAVEHRVAYLVRHAPAIDRVRMPRTESLRTHTLLAWSSVLIWLVVLALSWRLGQIGRLETSLASALLLTLISFIPLTIWFSAAQQRTESWFSLWQNYRELITTFAGIGLMLAGVVNLFVRGSADLDQLGIVGLHWAVTLGLFLAGILVLHWQQSRAARHLEFTNAWNRLDFGKVISISDQAPPWLAADLDRRYLVALSKGAVGRFSDAIADLRQIDQAQPLRGDRLTWLAAIQVEAEFYEEALQTTERIKVEFPNLGIGEAITARIFRRQGRLEEARSQASRAMDVNSHYANICAAAAGIEIELGDYVRARELLDRAHQLEPGTPQELAESARLALATESPEIAADKLNRAIAAFEANPLMIRQSEIVALRKAVTELRNAPINRSSTL